MSLFTPDNSDPFSLAGSVGRNGNNDRADVIKAQILLANAGYLDLPYPGVPTGWSGDGLARAIVRLQKDNGLEPDGILLPLPPTGISEAGEGETMQAMKEELSDRFRHAAAPTPDEVDRFWDERARRNPDGDDEPPTAIRLRAMEDEDGGLFGVVTHAGMPPPRQTLSDIPGFSAPIFQAGVQEARGGGIQMPGIVRTQPRIPGQPMPESRQLPPAPQPPRLPLAEPELRQGPLSSNRVPGQRAVPLTPEQQDMIRQWQHEEYDPRKPSFGQPTEEFKRKPGAESPQRGRIVFGRDGELIQVPPLLPWVDRLDPEWRKIADKINDAVAIEMALHTGGSRGNPKTQKGINIALQECMKELQQNIPDADIRHVFGGNQDGRAELKALPEEHLPPDEGGRTGSNRVDFSIVIARNIVEMVRGNTYDSRADGTPTDREEQAEKGVNQKAPDDHTVMIRKQMKATTDDEFREYSRGRCRQLAKSIRADWEKRGEFLKPAPEIPGDYQGTPGQRRARELRKQRDRK